jgi:hypothetical protein
VAAAKLLVADDLSPSKTCRGSGEEPTPWLDAVIKQGVRKQAQPSSASPNATAVDASATAKAWAYTTRIMAGLECPAGGHGTSSSAEPNRSGRTPMAEVVQSLFGVDADAWRA